MADNGISCPSLPNTPGAMVASEPNSMHFEGGPQAWLYASSMMNSALGHAVVFHQLDDINALGDALASASQVDDPEQLASLHASLDRFAVAMGWHRDAVIPAALAYAREHATFAEDLFAPAFILQAIAPAEPETAALLAELPAAVRELLHLAVTSMAATEV